MKITYEKLSFITALSQIGTWIESSLTGVLVGQDKAGNRYFRAKRTKQGLRERRWVLYLGEPDASLVPPEWHGWLHHNSDAPLPENSPYHKAWVKPHLPNLTGTSWAYRPPGHTLSGGKRDKATGDYVAWKPE